jgi:hypothetical protein
VWADEQLSLIPDFIANCGMARVFAYLMSDAAELTDQAIFADVSNTIYQALHRTHSTNPAKTRLSQTSYQLALTQLI